MLVNYRFLGWVVCILFILPAGAQPVGNNGTIVVVMPVKPSPRIAFAAGYLGRSLHKAGYDVSKTTSVQKVKKGQLAIVLKVNSGPANPGKEGYSILLEQNQPGSIVGGDESGLLYGCMELAETVDHVGKLPENFSRSDKPEMVLRGTCIGIQKPYYLPGRTVYDAFLHALQSGGWQGRRVYRETVEPLYAQPVPVTVHVWEICRRA